MPQRSEQRLFLSKHSFQVNFRSCSSWPDEFEDHQDDENREPEQESTYQPGLALENSQVFASQRHHEDHGTKDERPHPIDVSHDLRPPALQSS